MSDPISREGRVDAINNVDHMEHSPEHMRDVICGYEALALELESVLDKTRMWAVVCQNSEKYEKEKCADLEQKIEDKSLKILALTEEMMNAEEASLVKIFQLERRLKIAEEALEHLQDTGMDLQTERICAESLAAIAKEKP